jgi:hypothetical protein
MQLGSTFFFVSWKVVAEHEKPEVKDGEKNATLNHFLNTLLISANTIERILHLSKLTTYQI